MHDACMSCPAAERCDFIRGEHCDELLEKLVEDSREEYYKAWLEYIGEYADS